MKLQLLALLIMQSLFTGARSQTTTTDPGLFDTESGSGGPGSGSGEGSGCPPPGSGSGEGSGCLGCYPPQYSPPPQFTQISVAVAEIRCHLACTESVLRELNITLELDNTYPLWPTIPDDVIEQDCTVYQKIQGCKDGCKEHSMLPGATGSRCSSLCSRSCVLDCGGDLNCTQDGTRCPRICNKENCRVGCQLYEDEIQSSSPQPDMLPLSPFEAPNLTIPNDPRPSVYGVSVRNSTQDVTSGQIGIPTATTFLFRVLRTGTKNSVSYYWLRTLNNLLDLVSYACDKGIYVQYKAVNKNGVSNNWSRPSIIDVYGSLIIVRELLRNPDPNFIITAVSPDLRPLFWKHARIEVTWRHPPEASQSLSHYTVTLHNPTSLLCGTVGQTIVVSKTESSAVIAALESPLEGPVGGCHYRISVSSHALSGDYIPPGSILIVDVGKKDTVPVPLNFQCEREWSEREGLFRFNISWSIPVHEVLTDSIQRFSLQTSLTPMTRNEFDIADIKPETNVSQYSYTTRGLPFSRNSGAYYKITMNTVTNYVTNIITPDEEGCIFDALPFPSATVNDIIISSDDITVLNVSRGVRVVSVWVGWAQPSSSVMSYEVRVTEDQAFEEDDDFGELFTQKIINISLAAVRVPLLMEIPEYKENNCVYLQVRSINIHRAVSNWSTPACIEIGELRVSVITEPPQPPAALSMKVLYIIIGVSAVMLVAVVIMVICVALACVKNRRVNKRAAEFLESNGDFHDKDSKPHKRDDVDHIQLLNVGTWELHPGSVVLETKLGHGAFGDVYQGVVRRGAEEIDEGDGGVAIKVLKGSSGELERQSFMDHIEQTKLVSYQSSCAGTAGDHVVKMIGCVSTRDPCCLISELPSRGDLLTFLQNQRLLLVEGTNGVEVTSHTLVQFAEQIAVGMEFLSSIGVVHGDLACRNMYLDNELLLKISDFGLSGCSKHKAKPRAYHRTDDGRLPMRWLALESLEEGQFNSATDVWGYGVTLWEIATLGGFPYSTVGHKDLVAHLEVGERLEKPPNCSQHLYNLMSLCWAEESLERPSFTDLREALVSLQSQALPTQLLTLEIESTLMYYNVVLSTSTPEHSGSSKGGDGNTSDYWQRRDKVGDEGHSFSLPIIVEDEQEDIDQLQSLGQYTQSTTYTTQTIVVETYDIENGSTGSECDGISKIDSECTGSISPTSPSPVSSEKSEILKQNLSQLSESYSADNLNGTVSCDNHVICEELQMDNVQMNSTDLSGMTVTTN